MGKRIRLSITIAAMFSLANLACSNKQGGDDKSRDKAGSSKTVDGDDTAKKKKAGGDETGDDKAAGGETIDKIQMETLLRVDLEGTDDKEVIVSRVGLPPGTVLPQHTHPGQEFVTVIDGEVTMVIKDQPEVTLQAGKAFAVPVGAIHYAKTTKSQVRAVVFRIHTKGQPERTPVK